MTKESSTTFQLSGKNIVILGGTGHLGTSLSLGLVKSGARVLAVGRNEQKLTALAEEAGKFNGLLRVSVCDVHDAEGIENIVLEFENEFGPVSGWVNNAYQPKGNPTFLESNRQEITKSLEYLTSTIINTQIIAKLMIRNKLAGSIVNISSMYGLVSPKPFVYKDLPQFGNPPVYGAIKSGMNQFTRYAAVHLAPFKIRVNTLSPGAFPQDTDDKVEFIERLKREIPAGRIGIPGDLINGLNYLLSDTSSYVTGTNLVIDGGWTAW